MQTHTDLAGLQTLLDSSPLHRLLQLRLVESDREAQRVTVRMPFTPASARDDSGMQYHGGALASLIDIAGDFALIAVLGHGVPTINLRVDYLRAAAPPYLDAVAQVQRAGRSIGVVDITVTGANGDPVALGRGCYSTRAG